MYFHPNVDFDPGSVNFIFSNNSTLKQCQTTKKCDKGNPKRMQKV
jgi:hypothetical protein